MNEHVDELSTEATNIVASNEEATTEDIEEWRPVVGYEGRYAVSSIGRVKSLLSGTRYGKILNMRDVGGRICVTLTARIADRSVATGEYVDVLVARAFLGFAALDKVNHIDGNKHNNKPCNLIKREDKHETKTKIQPIDEVVETLPGESWRPVVGYEGLYEVSDKGRVRRLPKGNKNGRLLIQYLNTNGYYFVSLYKKNDDGKSHGKSKDVHKIVADAFLPPKEGASDIDHINGIKTDNRLCNLRRCTHKENMNNPVSKKKRRDNIELKKARGEYKTPTRKKLTKDELVARRERSGRRIVDLSTGRVYLSVQDAAERLNISADSIRLSARRYGVPRKKQRTIWRNNKPVLSFAYIDRLI